MGSLRSGLACLLTVVLSACGGDSVELPLLPPDSSLSYDSPPAFTVGTPISPIVPAHNAFLTNYSVVPVLPAGLVLDSGTGVISGTPTQPSPATRYTVSVPDGTVAITATLVITVNPLPANVGSSGAILHAGPRALSLDSTGHGQLWNTVTGAVLARFDDVVDVDGRLTCALVGSNCLKFLGLAGETAVVQNGSWLEVFDGSGGRLSRIEVPPVLRWWRLSRDGSYVVAATDTQMTVWSPRGVELFTRLANYGHARPVAAAGELRIAAGPAGDHVIETIAVPSGVASMGATYTGSFQSWSEDGERFSTSEGSIYALRAGAASEPTNEPGTSHPAP